MISAGRVLLMPKGDYAAATTYEMLDIVSYNGNSYVAKGTTTGNLPTDTTYWQLLAYGGAALNLAGNFATVETTQYASRAYAVGDYLVDKDSQLCRVTATILQGSEIIVNTNVVVKTVTDLINSVKESIAVIETNPASYSHNTGDRFWLSDVLYKATADITAGNTLTAGTNITPDDISTEIDELRTDFENADQAIRGMIAITETSATAAHNYEIGDQFIYQDALCKAKTAISVGDTLVLNTNYVSAGLIGDQLSDVKQALSNVEGENVTDNEPYILRQGKGNMVDLDLVGGSLGWNQLVEHGNFDATTGWICEPSASVSFTVSNNVGSVMFNNSATYVSLVRSCPSITGHKYLFSINVYLTTSLTGDKVFRVGFTTPNVGSQMELGTITPSRWSNVTAIISASSNFTRCAFSTTGDVTYPQGTEFKYQNAMAIDLTAMFGPTIADYIYSLEQANAGDGVAWLRQYFNADYYAYDAGSLQHVNPSARKASGFNLWDEEWEVGGINTETGLPVTYSGVRAKNFCGILPNISLFIRATDTYEKFIYFYDANKNFIYSVQDTQLEKFITTPSNAAYFKIGFKDTYGPVYKYDICMNISKTTGTPKNGDYVPYNGATANIPKVPLRGVPKLVNNKLAFNGDIRKANGTVTRKYGIVDLGTLNWAITNNCFVSQNLSSYGAAKVNTATGSANPIICSKYSSKATRDTTANYNNLEIGLSIASIAEIVVKDSTYTDEVLFKTAMSGVYAVYELATPTTETVAPFQNPQSAYTDGIEEFVYDSGTAVPVGNNSVYQTSEIAPLITEYANGVGKAILDWKLFETAEIDTSDGTYTTQAVPDGTHEILVQYGTKNSSQVYGGGSMIFNYDTDSIERPAILPIFKTTGQVALVAITYRGNSYKTLQLFVVNNTSGGDLRFEVYVR